MLTVDSIQFSLWLSQYFWPFIRFLALISTAPVLNEKNISKKTKIGLAMTITILVAPNLPTTPIPLFSMGALWVAIQQILLGAAIGLTMQFTFAAVRLAGEVIGLQMGLSFATFLDPVNGINMPILARLFNLLAILLFLSFNGHLWMISLLAESFYMLPISIQPLSGNGFLALVQTAGLIFINGLMLALPIITLLLTLSAALGLLNRITPQLSIFVVGFSLTLTVGILALSLLMPLLAPFTEYLFREIMERLVDTLIRMQEP